MTNANGKGSPTLQVKKLTKRFDGVTALNQVDMEIYEGEILSLIGPNGSGKTTMFNCITGFLKPEEGEIFFKGKPITNARPNAIALHGICRTFQNVRILPGLTVFDNLMVALQQHQEDNLLQRSFHTPHIRQLEAASAERVNLLLEQVGLAGLRNLEAHNLVYGQRKLLEFACALCPDPDLILLDEPAAGVNTSMVDQMKEHIIRLNQEEGKTFLVVEHNMGVVMDLSQRIVVLDYGKKIAEGTPSEIQQNELVREAYFGR